MKIAFVTYQDAGKFNAAIPQEDELLKSFLTKKGLDFVFEVWDNPAVDWEQYDALIIKSPWDYFEKAATWYAWLDKVKHLKVLNPVSVLRWNSDKIYLQEIADAGFDIVPSEWLDKGKSPDWDQLFSHFDTKRLIIKPRISGGALHTYALSDHDSHKMEEIEELLQEFDFMAQPFIQQIPDKGEWSFIFFNNQLSHTILKTAKEGEFRVQHFFGGTIHAVEAPSYLLKTAQELVNQFAKGCLYARVDGVEIEGQLHLVELELIEPLLFMFTDEHAFENYYKALKQML